MYTLGTHGCETPAKRIAAMKGDMSRQKAIRRGQAGENPAMDDQIARLEKAIATATGVEVKPAPVKAPPKPKKGKKAKKRKKSA